MALGFWGHIFHVDNENHVDDRNHVDNTPPWSRLFHVVDHVFQNIHGMSHSMWHFSSWNGGIPLQPLDGRKMDDGLGVVVVDHGGNQLQNDHGLHMLNMMNFGWLLHVHIGIVHVLANHT